MLNNLFERQDNIQAQVEKYAPIREVFEEFLKTGQKLDEGLFWWMSPGSRHSRYNWERKETIAIPGDERTVVVEALTDFQDYRFGHLAGDVEQALISVNVSLAENPNVGKELDLPPVWAISEQDPSTMRYIDLDRLEKDVEEIVPLIRACLPQG